VIATTNPDVKAAFTSVLNASSTNSAHLQEWSNDWNAGLANGAWANDALPVLDARRHLGATARRSPTGRFANVFPNGGGNWGGSFLTVHHPGKATPPRPRTSPLADPPEQQIAAFVTTGNYPSQVAAYNRPHSDRRHEALVC